MKPTVREIAKAAGVSIASVSLVLNDKPSRITEETKFRIIETAREMGYEFKKPIRFELIGAVLGVVRPLQSSRMIDESVKGIHQYAGMHNYKVVTVSIQDSTEKELAALEILRKAGVEGVIVIPPADMNDEGNHTRWGECLEYLGLPFVLLDQAIDRVYCDFITSDNKSGGYMAAEYLIHKDYKKIGMIAGKREIYTMRKRIEGYKEALVFHNLSINDNWIIFGDLQFQTGYEGMEQLVAAGADAVVICGEEMVIGAYQYAKDQDIRIGDSFAVIGFYDFEDSGLLSPSLTAVKQPGDRMGKAACEALLKRISGEDKEAVRTTYFAPELVEGESV